LKLKKPGKNWNWKNLENLKQKIIEQIFYTGFVKTDSILIFRNIGPCYFYFVTQRIKYHFWNGREILSKIEWENFIYNWFFQKIEWMHAQKEEDVVEFFDISCTIGWHSTKKKKLFLHHVTICARNLKKFHPSAPKEMFVFLNYEEQVVGGVFCSSGVMRFSEEKWRRGFNSSFFSSLQLHFAFNSCGKIERNVKFPNFWNLEWNWFFEN
jgi:hypothetical protein